MRTEKQPGAIGFQILEFWESTFGGRGPGGGVGWGGVLVHLGT